MTVKKVVKKAVGKKAAKKPVGKIKSKVQLWAEQINRSGGGNVMVIAADKMNTSYALRRPTGIFGMDMSLGGGIHSGGIIEIWGSESVGKTHLAYRIAGEIQRIYGEETAILIYTTEAKPDKGFARLAGLRMGYTESEIADYENLRGIKYSAEERADLRTQVGDIMVIAGVNAEEGLNAVVDGVKEGHFQLVILESLGALLPKAAAEKDVGDARYGGSSRVLTDMVNQLNAIYVMNPELETTIIGINQARAVMNAQAFQKKTKQAAGAHAWKHGQLVSIELSNAGAIKTEPPGKKIRWTLTKGKAGTHDGKTGIFDYRHLEVHDPVFWETGDAAYTTHWLGGVDTNKEATEMGIVLKIFKKKGAWITWEEDGEVLIELTQGIENFASVLTSDDALFARFKKQVIKKLGILVRYK